MAALTGLWTPPPGMTLKVITEWRSFYSTALDSYGVTPQAYRDMYVAQHGTCYICRKAVGKNPDDPRGTGSRRLGVDHNHVTGNVRGLLCTGGDKTCNRIIGWLSLPALQRAVKYVETEPGQTVLNARQDIDRWGGWSAADVDDFLTAVLGLK